MVYGRFSLHSRKLPKGEVMVAKRTAVLGVLTVMAALLVVGAGYAGRDRSRTTAAGGLKIGMVTDVGGLNDRGFNHLAYVGLQQAQSKLGAKIQVAESKSPADYIPNLASFARQGYDLVVGVGYTEIAAMGAVAKRFPDTRFAIVDVSDGDLAGKPKNVLGLLFREEQVGYLAGYLAGLEAKRLPGRDVVSSVAGEKQPPVDRFVAGYQAGAKKADPGIKTLNGYSQDFTDQAKCKAIALNQIAAGSVAVFQVAGGCGLGALDAARQEKVWGIGVDADQAFLGPHILTSATKRVNRAVFLAIQSVAKGKFKGGDAVYGLAQGGVGLGRISSKVPKREVAAVAKIQRQIVAGEIRIPKTVSG
jgi:basic membrane protein A